MHGKGERAEFDALLQSAWEAQKKRDKWAESRPQLANRTPEEAQSKLPTGDRLAVLLALGGGGLAIMLVLLHLTSASTLVLLVLLFAMWFYPVLYFATVFFAKLTSMIISVTLLVIVVGTIGVIEWPPKSLVDMSPRELKQNERKLANDMREIENTYNQSEIDALTTNDTAGMMKVDQRRQARFQKEYLPAASAMRCELLRREYQPCPAVTVLSLAGPNGDPRLLAFIGQLVGPMPLNEAASYLDELASRLHD
jgi:hypothetical protein